MKSPVTRKRKILKRCLWTILVVFILINGIAYLHAYKFTHFDTSSGKTPNPEQLSFGDKLKLALFGVSNPRPRNTQVPDTIFKTIVLSSNKRIEGWLIPVQSSRGTVILFHGYGGEKSSMLDKALVFRQLGYSTFLIDFMGSGGSEGNQTTIGFKEAMQVRTAVEYLKLAGENQIILFGTSLGATAVMKAVSEYHLPVHSIIIECPFATMLQTVKNRFSSMGVPAFPMAHLLVFWGGVQNGFNAFQHNPVEYAKKITCPTLLMHGAKDQRVTEGETAAVYRNLAGPKKLIVFPLAGHENYLLKYKTEWKDGIAGFLDAALGSRLLAGPKALYNQQP